MTEALSEANDPVRLYRARLAIIDRIDALNLATAASRSARGEDIGEQLSFLTENYERRQRLVRPVEA